jgi:dTDP-D-glucose 4,6-dehydratase
MAAGNRVGDGLSRTVAWYLENESWWSALLATRYDGSRLGRPAEGKQERHDA